MPETLLGEARSRREGFRTLPFGFERLTLHAHRLCGRRDVRMAQRLAHCPFRRSMLAQALGTALRLFAPPARIDAPARGALRQGRGRDGAPEARWGCIFDAVMRQHRAIVSRHERRCARRNFAGLRVETENETGKRPCDVVCRDRTIRRRGDKHAPYRALRLGMTDRRQRRDPDTLRLVGLSGTPPDEDFLNTVFSLRVFLPPLNSYPSDD